MSNSNTIVRILAVAACGAGGYFVASAFNVAPPSAENKSTIAEKATQPVQALKLPTAAESAMISEWEQLNSSNSGDYSAMYAAIKDTKDAFRRRAFRSALIAEWSVRDPQAALRYILEKDPNNAGQLAREWLRHDPQGAITGMLGGDEKMRARLKSLLTEIAKVAPGRLVEVMATFKAPLDRWDTTATDAFATFAGNDLEAARIAAQSVNGDLRGQAIAGVAKAWAEKDGSAALAWAQALPAGDARDQALKAVLAGWAKTDPIAALGKLDLAPPGGDEMYHASDTGAQVLREAAKKDWNATISWLKDNPGKLGRSSLDGLQNELSRRLRTDTISMMELLASKSVPALDQVFGNSVLNEGYSQRDAIWTWLDGQPSNDTTRNLRSSLLNAMGYKEPEATLSFLEKIADTPENASILDRGISSLFNGGSRMDLADALIDKAPLHLRARLIETSFNYGWRNVGTDPARLVSLMNELPAERRQAVMPQVASNIAANDPQAAVKWASTIQNASSRDGALASIAGTWAGNDPHEAARWVDSLPAGSGRDSASRNLVSAIARSEPETAWTWALNIQSEQSRLDSLRMAYMGLKKKDAAIADQMLENSNLPAAQVKALRDSYKPGMENQFFPR